MLSQPLGARIGDLGAQGQEGLYTKTVSNPTCAQKKRQFSHFSY